ncbi:MAG: hypothetical protein Kow0020_08440 [Wenzhouxiangellaceae bacterium]
MKRWFISLYLLLLGVLTIWALTAMPANPVMLGPAGLMLAAGAPLAFFIWLVIARPARTESHPVLVSIAAGLGAVLAASAEYRFGPQYRPLLVAALAALAGWLAYLRWYSRLPSATGLIGPGQALPAVDLLDLDGTPVSTQSLRGHPAVLLFYRGNWCPLCTAQIRELAEAWRSAEYREARLWFISSQSQAHTRNIARRFAIPASFLRDPDNRAARLLGILAPGATPAGLEWLGYPSDAAIPTVIVVDANGIVRFVEAAGNYRLRPDPKHYLHHLQEH